MNRFTSIFLLLISALLLAACEKVDFGNNGGITERDNLGFPGGHSDNSDWGADATWKKVESDLFKGLNFDLNGTQQGGVRDIIFYPNPVTTIANLSIQQTGSATQFAWVVTDRKYKVVKELVKDVKVSASGSTYRFDFSSLKKGETYRMYYVLYTGTNLVIKGHGDIQMIE